MPGHEDMNTRIRRACGYPPAEAAPPPTEVGDLGVGRGAGAAERRPQPPVPSMTNLIRAARMERRERIHELAVYLDGEGRPWVG
jgi:hypothetical protein